MSQSSIFPTAEPAVQNVSCRPTPDVAVYYDGSNTDAPTLVAGNIVFGGTSVKTNRPADGIGATGYGTEFKVPFSSILHGGAGVKLRCAQNATQERIRFTATAGVGNIYLRLKPLFSCEQPYEYDEEIPIMVYYRPGVVDSVCQKLNRLANLFNIQYAHLGTASVVQVSSVYYIDFVTKNVGERFQVLVSQGLTGPSHITPGYKGAYTTDLIAEWFGARNVATIPNAPSLQGAELYIRKQIPGFTLGAATSNPNQDAHGLVTIPQTVTVLFANNTNGTNARAALIALLNTDSNQYTDRIVVNECEDKLLYDYTIVRTDAGDVAAFNQIKTDYPAVVGEFRAQYNGTQSTYGITTASTTKPTAVGSDVTTVGSPVIVNATFTFPC